MPLVKNPVQPLEVAASLAAPARLRIVDGRSFFSGLLFILAGLAGAGIGLGYSIGSAMRMGAGYFPLLVGLGLASIGVLVALRSVAIERGPRVQAAPEQDEVALRAALSIGGGVLAFAWLVPTFGLLLATVGMTLISGLARRQARLLELLALSLVLAAFAGLVFAWGLGLNLPVLPVAKGWH
ncbi:tripartite tricarboxylate transporter TctB family protein [Pseudomonas putida]|uniref:tripartite tricarboxylate transporter TctB family protein n=1 Tax=Pseudomonas putida TaxID=303 RepID=UPI0023643FE7|nr:tripartite tricarboxylate transporter TctB family protein [Pseudomonas putida]MDD2052503.1 tripartite tricarboxylate transporter TctB family protein [Pseudomonas putida]